MHEMRRLDVLTGDWKVGLPLRVLAVKLAE